MISWEFEFTDQFGNWWEELTEVQQKDVQASVGLLMALGPRLPFPHSSGISGSRHSHMRELRIQSLGKPLRIFYAFDPRHVTILLIGGQKSGDDRFYQRNVPLADDLYDAYMGELRQEGLLK